MIINQKKAGILISYSGLFVRIITGLVYSPIMLRLLGQSEYGLYQLVNSVVSYMSLLSLGFGASYIRFYSKEKANDEKVAILNGMYMTIFIVISLICILCGVVMITNIHFIFKNGLTNMEYYKARALMALMVVSMSFTFPNIVFNCIIASQERFVFQKTIILLQSVLNPFLSLPLLLMGYGSIGIVCVSTMLSIFVLVSNAYYCLRKLNAKFCFGNFEMSLFGEMGIFTLFIFMNELIDQVNWNVDRFLLGRMVGTISVAVYSVGAQINSLYIQLSTSISNVFVTKVNSIVTESDDERELTNVFVKVGRIQFAILFLIATGFIIYGKSFIKLWAGDRYGDAYYVVILLIVPVTIPLIQNIGIEIQRAKNKHRTRSIVYFIIAITNIIISVPLIKKFGSIGAATGTAISLLLGNGVFMNWYYSKKLNIDIVLFWKNISSFLPALLFPVLVGVLSINLVSINSVSILLTLVMIYSIVYFVCIYTMAMTEEEKGWVSKPFKIIMNR